MPDGNSEELISEACSSCGSIPRHSYDYDEGSIYICQNCGLKWAKLTSIVPIANQNATMVHDRYMDPQSIGDPSKYQPYADFFSYLERVNGPQKLRIFDIGCGNGVFIAECLRRGHEIYDQSPFF